MLLCLADWALLVTLFYSTVVALLKFWTLKGKRKGLLMAKNLRIMITKSEKRVRLMFIREDEENLFP